MFDAAAPRLLLVAMHLTDDAALAEDLVQTVFLQVLRDAADHDGDRPVLPWLLGILNHRAQDQRRSTQRRRRREARAVPATVVAGSVANVDATPDPERVAIDRETRAQISSALDGLPQGYREVLALRLVHGLRAVDIAHALGQPPATVRTKLRRGLEMLRSALPPGLAAPALLAVLAQEVALARDGLPAIRAEVLGALTATGSVVGVSLTGKYLLAAAGILILLAGTFVVQQASAPAPPPNEVPGASLANAAAMDAAEPGQRSSARVGDAERTAVAIPERTDEPKLTVLRGRAIASESGQPLALADVMLRATLEQSRADELGRDDPRNGTAAALAREWHEPRTVQTAADGTFAYRFASSPLLFFQVEIDALGRQSAHRGLDSIADGADVDLGDLELEPGTPIVVEVSVDGRPAAGIPLNAAPIDRDAETTSTHWYGNTDERGRVELGVVGWGPWHYDLECEFAGPRVGEFTVPRQLDRHVVTIALQAPPRELSLRGTLVDQRGEPVPDVELQLPVPGSYGYYPVRTASDGSFLFAINKPWESGGTWRFRLPKSRRDLEWIDDGGELTWGADDLRLVVRRRAPATLRITVIDAVSREPVEWFGASCWSDTFRHGASPQLKGQPVRSHPGGVREFEDLMPGGAMVSVFPAEPYGDRGEIPIELAEGERKSMTIEVAPVRSIDVLAHRRGTTEPMAGVEIQIAKVVPADAIDVPDLGRYRTSLRGARKRGSSSSHRSVIVLASTTTNGAGRGELEVPQFAAPLVVFVSGPDCLARTDRAVRLPAPGEPLRIEVDPAMRVRGVLGPPAFVTRFGPAPDRLQAARTEFEQGIGAPPAERFADDYPEVLLRAAGEDHDLAATYVDAQGNFELTGLPAGQFEVWAKVIVRSGPRGGSGQNYGPLAVVDVQPGSAPVEVALDAAAHLPARVRGTFFVNGEAWAGVAGFARLTRDGGVRHVNATRDAHGVYVSPWLEPGRYLAFAHFEPRPDVDRYAYDLAPIAVDAGGIVDVRPVIASSRLVLTVRDATGAPAADVRVVPELLDHPHLSRTWRWGERSDSAGRIVFDPAPPGRLHLRAFAPGQDPRAEAPELDLGQVTATSQEVTRTLPR